MKKLLLLFFILSLIIPDLSAQVPAKYFQLTKEAKENFWRKDYKKSVVLYREAFKLNSWKAFCQDRYDAACSNAQAGYKDSAFFQLFKIAELYDYSDYDTLSKEVYLRPLHSDKRWPQVLDKIKQNIGKSESKLNKQLVVLLDSVYRTDQSARLNAVAVNNEFGPESAKAKEMQKKIRQIDSINLSIVVNVIEKYGWIGKDVVGSIGNSTLGLMIQRADIKLQEKYLPVMREAYKNNNVDIYDLVELEDIVALKQKRKQIYGSQLKSIDKRYYVLPMEDPETIDERRSKMGLNTMDEYLRGVGTVWNINDYKNGLMIIEAKKLQY